MHVPPFVLDQLFQVAILYLFQLELLPQGAGLDFEVIYLLGHELLILLELRAHALDVLLIRLDVDRESALVVGLHLDLVSFFLALTHRFVRQLQLMSQVVDMPFQCFDLGDIVLLLRLQVLDGVRRATHVLLEVKGLLVQLVVLLGHLLDGLLVPFVLSTRVSVVLEDVLLLHFEGSDLLLGESLLVLELLLLLLEVLVSLGRLGELLVDELVLSGKSLDVLSQLRAFGLLDVDDLGLVVDLLSEGLVLLSKELDLVFTLEEAALELVLLA